MCYFHTKYPHVCHSVMLTLNLWPGSAKRRSLRRCRCRFTLWLSSCWVFTMLLVFPLKRVEFNALWRGGVVLLGHQSSCGLMETRLIPSRHFPTSLFSIIITC